MKPSVPLLLLPALVAAEQAVVNDFSSPPQIPQPPSMTGAPTTAQSIPIITPAPTSHSMSPLDYEQLPHALKQFIMEMAPRPKLEERQQAAGGGGGAAGGGVAPGGGVPAAGATPTQVSPVTTYNIGGGDIIYTQSFKSPPDQWSSPAPGTIGMGTLAGQDKLGKVKTYANPAPTHAPERLMGAMLAGGVGAAMVL